MEIGGIDADQIVSQLMQIEERPLVVLQSRKNDAKTAADAIGRIRTKVDAFRLAADRLSLASSFERFATTVSDTSVVAAAVSGSAAVSSLAFTVDQLAQAHGLRSIGTVASDSVTVTTDSLLAVAAGTRPIGVGAVRAGAGLGTGELTLSVTQASTSARVAGTSALATSTLVDGSNDTLDVTVDGVARTITIAAGTYDEAGLAAAVQAAFDATGAGVTAALGGSGALALSTTREGSNADIQITGGSALAALGMTVDASAHVGTDGVIDVNGTLTTVTSIEPGQAVAVDTGAGTLDVTLSGGLRVGEADVAVVSTGDRSLADVAAAITSAGQGVTAAAVQVGAGAWRLQLSATATGEDAQIAIDAAAFAGIGGLIESSAAVNARITIGSGPGAYDIEASGNTFANVVPGVTLTAKAVSATPVTVTVGRDDAAIADDVANLVSKVNDLLADIKVQTRSDPVSGTSGPLSGNATMRALAEQVRTALSAQVAGIGTGLPSSVGIERDRDGSFTFDRQQLLDALTEDAAAVARLFSRGGTDSGDVTFAVAGSDTVSGSYDVEITTAATRATSALLFDGGAVGGTRVGIRVGSTTATLDVQAGQSAAQIVDGLNAALAEAGLDVIADLDGTGLRIRADEWGSGGDFELNTDVLGAGTWDGLTGTDVEGTIDGIVATGSGRRLVLTSTASSPAAGLGVDVAGGVTGAVGAVAYVPGIAARVVEVTTALTRVDTGMLTSAKQFADARIDDFNDQISRLEERLDIREINMRRQWASLQTLLSSLQTQGDWISGQLASLSTNWGGSRG